MNERPKILLKDALKSNDGFFAFIKQEAQSTEYQELNKAVEQGSHPKKEELYDYVLGWLSKEENEKIRYHLAVCSKCDRDVLIIMSLEEDLEEDLLKSADKIPVIDRLKNLIANTRASMEAFILPTELVLSTRGNFPITWSSLKKKNDSISQYHIGEQVIFTVTAPEDGHIVVFHYTDSGKVQLVFPYSSLDNTFASAGSDKQVFGKITEPLGIQNFKAIWTRNELLDSKTINFEDASKIDQVVGKFLDDLEGLNEEDWGVVIYIYEVIDG